MSHTATPPYTSTVKTHWQYTNLYGQLGMRLYPFGRPTPDPGLSCTNLFKHTRPFFYQSLGVTRSSGVGTVTLTTENQPALARIRVDMSHWVGTYKLGAGV